MDRYYLDLTGLRVLLDTAVPLELSSRVQPFLCEPFPDAPDCTICVDICPELPKPEGLWRGPECYFREGGQMRTFHCNTPQGEPFAVTQMDGKGNVYIRVKPAFAGNFSGISGIFNRIGMENLLLRHDGLLLHASLIDYNRHGIAFAGPSGVGKSTQARLWQRCLGAALLNGDRAALRKTGEGWLAYGSLYAGTSGVYKKESAPLEAIVVLRQAGENRLTPLSAVEAFKYIWPELSVQRWDADQVSPAMALCGALVAQVPVYLLECLPEESAVVMLKKGLNL